jgi:glycosyltransferase involved in cell wall biosynthesis
MTTGQPFSKPRLLFLITEDWYFWMHWLDLARAARDAGMDVTIATRVRDHGERIAKEGFTLIPIGLSRRSRQPVRELLAIIELIRVYRRVRPDIVHHVAMKPMLYGSLAARFARVPAVVNAFAGLGYAFTSMRRGLLRFFLDRGLQWALALPHSRVIFQNQDDAQELLSANIVRKPQIRIIRGVGVDTDKFSPALTENEDPLVLYAGRMLWDKGIREFVHAARLLKATGLSAKCVLVGRVDPENPTSISVSQLRAWQQEGIIEWWSERNREDMPHIVASAQVVVLPSYREGLPEVLLEAGACGRPVVATDVPGCREVVKDGVNGILVPPRDAGALSKAIARLLQDPLLRRRMGTQGRELVVKEFSLDQTSRQVLKLYGELLRPLAMNA